MHNNQESRVFPPEYVRVSRVEKEETKKDGLVMVQIGRWYQKMAFFIQGTRDLYSYSLRNIHAGNYRHVQSRIRACLNGRSTGLW